MMSSTSHVSDRDEDETMKVAKMKTLPGLQDIDDRTLRRFLRARGSDVEKASAMLLKNLAWRRAAVPKGFVSETEIQNQLAYKKVFAGGYDKTGSPLGVVFANRHYPSKKDLDEFKRFVVYVLDAQCSRFREEREMFTWIVDFQGWGYSNCDIRGYHAALDILQSNYPERLGTVFLVHAPYLFVQAWKIIYPFIDENTRHKFIFVEDKKLKAKLLEHIDDGQLPEKYGGKFQLIPIEEYTN